LGTIYQVEVLALAKKERMVSAWACAPGAFPAFRPALGLAAGLAVGLGGGLAPTAPGCAPARGAVGTLEAHTAASVVAAGAAAAAVAAAAAALVPCPGKPRWPGGAAGAASRKLLSAGPGRLEFRLPLPDRLPLPAPFTEPSPQPNPPPVGCRLEFRLPAGMLGGRSTRGAG